mgnify:CR=1 FL=1
MYGRPELRTAAVFAPYAQPMLLCHCLRTYAGHCHVKSHSGACHLPGLHSYDDTTRHAPFPFRTQNLRTIGGQIVAKGNGNLRDLLPLTSLTSLSRLTQTNNGDNRLELPPALEARFGAGGSAAVATAAAASSGGAGQGTRADPDASVVLVYAGQAPDL